MTSKLDTRATEVRRARRARNLSQADLARRAGISRQALGAIESGTYRPGVAVALALASALGETVEGLFGKPGENRVEAALGAGRTLQPQARVALARLGGRVVAVGRPEAALRLAPADGIVGQVHGRRAAIEAFRSAAEIDSALVLAGCDPAVAILADWLARSRSGARVISLGGSSQSALAALAAGSAHAAGVHLRDARSHDYNLAAARRALGRHRSRIVTFARWELGIAVRAGNPASIRGFADLARPRLRLVNRERGSGARALLDEALAAAEIDGARIAGYAHEAPGHLEVSAAIAAGEADAGVTLRVAAESYGLDFIPVREERYDLVIAERELATPAVQALLEALNSGRFAREVSRLCTYDTSEMGREIARVA